MDEDLKIVRKWKFIPKWLKGKALRDTIFQNTLWMYGVEPEDVHGLTIREIREKLEELNAEDIRQHWPGIQPSHPRF